MNKSVTITDIANIHNMSVVEVRTAALSLGYKFTTFNKEQMDNIVEILPTKQNNTPPQAQVESPKQDTDKIDAIWTAAEAAAYLGVGVATINGSDRRYTECRAGVRGTYYASKIIAAAQNRSKRGRKSIHAKPSEPSNNQEEKDKSVIKTQRKEAPTEPRDKVEKLASPHDFLHPKRVSRVCVEDMDAQSGKARLTIDIEGFTAVEFVKQLNHFLMFTYK
jgi:hypothetical protein